MHNVPRPVAWAAELTVFNAVAGFMYGLLWPDLADRSSVVVVGAVLSLLMLGGAYVLWRATRWSGQAFIAVNALNALLALPAPLSGDVGIAIAGVVSGLVSVAAIVFALRPEARAYRRRGAERSPSPTR